MTALSGAALRRRHFLQTGATCAFAAFSEPVLGADRPATAGEPIANLSPRPAQARIFGAR